MSEFLAEARILVRPDTTRFRAELEAQLAVLTGKPVVIPITAQFAGTATGATQEFAAAQTGATEAVLGLQGGLELENRLLAQNAVLLETGATAAAEDAAAQQAAGAAKTRAAVSAKALATQQALAATAAQKLALSQAEVAGAATEVTAAQVRLTRSFAAVAAAETALGAAVKAKNIALIDAASASLNAARAYSVEAEAALVAARAEAEHAATLGAVGTAGIASGASLLGLRGAVLTAGAAFLGATVAIQASVKAIGSASDTVEELNKTVVVFGESSQDIKDFAETAATSLGISNLEALRATGIFGNLFRSINITQQAAADMSISLVRLSSDLASFNNADPSQVLDNLRSGLVGEPEPLRKFGIFLSQVRAQQEALIVTGKKNIKQLTQSEIVQARYNIILRDGAIANGDFANTSDDLANQTRILKAQIQDLGAQLGTVLIPALRNTVDIASDYVGVIRTAASATENLAQKIPLIGSSGPGADSRLRSLAESAASLYGRFVLLGPVMGAATLAIDKFGDSSEKDAKKVDIVTDSIERLKAAIALIPEQVARVNFKNLTQSLNALEVAQLKIQTGVTPGGRAAEEANLRQQIEDDQKLVEAAASGTRARRDALEKLRADQQALAALQRQDAQDAEAAANASRSAADKAKRAQDEADQALLDLLSTRRQDAERKAGRAAQTASLQDDIRAQDRIQALIKLQIAKVRALVKDEQTRKNAIRELRIALIASRQEEEALRQQQLADAAAAAQTSIQLDIDFAETTGNVDREIRARQRLIALLKKQQAAVKKGTNEWKRLRNAIAEQQQAIKDAKEQADKEDTDRKSAQQFFFEQLQAQQGFAANLLGNLIPRGQTAGLVGNEAPTALDVGQRITVQASAAQGKALGGPTAGQANATNDLLLKILNQLKHLNGLEDAPEAKHQRRTGRAALDYHH